MTLSALDRCLCITQRMVHLQRFVFRCGRRLGGEGEEKLEEENEEQEIKEEERRTRKEIKNHMK